MSKSKFITFLLITFFLFSCSNSDNDKNISVIKKPKQNEELILAFEEAYEALNLNDPYFAAKRFLEAELLYPQSKWAAKSVLMASYAYYLQDFYPEAISNLERYLKTYPFDENKAYAHYLIAICYYETISDEKRDTAPLLNSKSKFIYVVKNYPNTDFAIDAKYKLNLIDDLLASKEMYLARHYIKKEKWIAAINRLRVIIDEYEQSIFTEEALHRLVEVYFKIGLLDESKKYANLLGYNYQSSEWYLETYRIFNKDYKINVFQPLKKDKKSVLDKFKKLFE